MRGQASIGRLPVQQATTLTTLSERRYLDTTQLSDVLHIGTKALEKWRLQGKGPRFIRCGKLVRYDEADVLAWIEQQKRSNTTEGARG